MRVRPPLASLFATTAVAIPILLSLAAPRAFADTYGPAAGGNIPDNSTTGISSTINVVNSANIVSLDSVTITGLTHTWAGDLVATLSHGGTTIDLFDRIGATSSGAVGSSGDFTGGTYTFQLGGTAIPTSGNIATGTYAPYLNGTAGQSTTNTGTFASFAGLNISGAWILNISDRVNSDTGSYTSWQFNATTGAVQPPPPGTYTGGTGGNIPDASFDVGTGNSTPGVFTSDILVSDNFNISAFNSITLDGLVHSFIGDLKVELIHVSTGKTVDLFNRVGQATFGDEFDAGDSSNLNGSYTFAPSGASLLAAASGGSSTLDIAGGTYAASTHADPAGANPNTLTSFNGENVGGLWRLRITDYSAGDTGSFSGWRFNVTPTVSVVPESSSLALILPVAGVVFATGLNRRRRARRAVVFGAA